eukprot:TRINITY_DN125_c0_g1_i3.p1 TRINITY_DN125_c0_g1~~TRINITY_DN125_c0_g1_i3.p1  ORF type:complete len:913 (+),score=238.66 TRINITY_DN125_c0_g1_i3:2483-5221(+)
MRLDGPSPNQYDIIRTWRGEDPCGNSVEESQSISVTDDIKPSFSFYPEDKEYNCDEIYVVGILNAVDNCGLATVDQDGPNKISGSCDNAYYLVTIWTASDAAGNEVEWIQTISVVDVEPPELKDVPDNVAVECDEIPLPTAVKVLDKCTKDIDPVLPHETKPDDKIATANDYSLVRTWTAQDNCGNKVVGMQTIYVSDGEDPVFDMDEPADVTVSCAFVPIAEVITATDNCVQNILVSFNEIRQNGNCDNMYFLSRSWTATDITGNSNNYKQEIKVYDDQPPVLNPILSDESVSCDAQISIPVVTATDTCSGDISVELTSETLTTNNPEKYDIVRTWRASDDCDLRVTQSQTIKVRDTVAPIVTGNSGGVYEIGNVPVPGNASAKDNCHTELPIHVPCIETKDVSSTCLYNYTLLYVCPVKDRSGNYNEHRYKVIVQDTIAPVFYFDGSDIGDVPPETVTVEYGQQPTLDDALMGVVAVDNSEHEIFVEPPDEVIQMPDPNNDHEYTMVWTYTACDDCGNCAQIDKRIVVQDTIAPCFSEEPLSGEVECDNIPPPCEVTTVDEDIPVTTDHSLVFQVGNEKKITRHWSAVDKSGNGVSYTQTLTLVDRSKPVFSRYPKSETVSCSCDNFPLAPTVNAIDNCDFTITVAFTEDKIVGISDDSYALERVWSAIDNSGNKLSHKQVITVHDQVAPVLSSKPPNIYVECDNIPEVSNIYLKDNCDPEVQVHYESIQDIGSCTDAYQITRQWTGADRSGNSVNHRQLIEVRDSQGPVFDFTPSECILPNGQYKEYSTHNIFVAHDNCDDVSIDAKNIHIYGCNSTHTTPGDKPFDVTCHFDSLRSILSVFADVQEEETNGRTYFLYAHANDRCGNQAYYHREFWIPFTEEDAAMEGLVCEIADVDMLVDNPYAGVAV